MLLFDATHTSHTTAQTGIQRVCRSLFEELDSQGKAAPVCFDPHLAGWRRLAPGELAVLRDHSGGSSVSRGAKWTLRRKISGVSRRWLGMKPALPKSSGLICPEIFSAKTGARLPGLFAATKGPRVAIFHDAIPLKFPELTAPRTVARFPAYLRELLLFDGVAAVSEDSAASLRDYWQWLGEDRTPAVRAIPLGVSASRAAPAPAPGEDIRPVIPRLLCVCTIEGRKNHRALLDACETLWSEGLRFELQLIGMARPDTAGQALARIDALKQAGRPLIFDGAVPTAALESAYRDCFFTVYPSLIEGFGMPVLESLQQGKPCICSGRGALGESARGGGCVPLDIVTGESLAAAMRRLLLEPAEVARLGAEARHRTLRSWPDYCRDFTAWMASLPRRS